jgi:hypothetical protein
MDQAVAAVAMEITKTADKKEKKDKKKKDKREKSKKEKKEMRKDSENTTGLALIETHLRTNCVVVL